MSVEQELQTRSEGKCELCNNVDGLNVVAVAPRNGETAEEAILICESCCAELETKGNVNHWRCLNDTMWSTHAPVQVMVWRILESIKAEGWPQDMLDMLYLEEETLAWAQEGGEEAADDVVKHLDSNGALLVDGDNVTLIKDLNVKGGGFTAKRGTTVRNISVVDNNAEHIEGRVEGQRIVILTQFVKKA